MKSGDLISLAMKSLSCHLCPCVPQASQWTSTDFPGPSVGSGFSFFGASLWLATHSMSRMSSVVISGSFAGHMVGIVSTYVFMYASVVHAR